MAHGTSNNIHEQVLKGGKKEATHFWGEMTHCLALWVVAVMSACNSFSPQHS